ncbi:MAG: YceH family protein [Bryobacterales bacterium]
MEYRTIRLAPKGPESEPSPVLTEGVQLTPEECRVLGCLVEKAITTPDYYPLTLNSLVSACNQKSSRDPVVEYGDADVLAAIDGLKEKQLATRITSSDSRVPRFRQLMADALRLNQPQLVALTVLMLRGHQTVGEIRSRTGRMYEFESLQEVEETLQELSQREPHALIVQLPRRTGEKEARWAHLLCGEPEFDPSAESAPASSRAGRTEELEARVAALEEEIAALREEFQKFREQF